MKVKKFYIFVFLVGAFLFLAPFTGLMEIFNPTVINNCDDLTNITVAYDYGSASKMIDTSDKMEGSGSLSVTYIAYQTEAYVQFGVNPMIDCSNTPILSFSVKCTAPSELSRVVVRSWSGSEYVEASYYYTVSGTDWVTVEIDLSQPDGGVVYLGGVRYFTFWIGSTTSNLIGETVKFDDLRHGSGSVSPTPSPSPTANPTPTPTATPHVDDFNMLENSMQISGLLLMAASAVGVWVERRKRKKCNR